MKAYHVWVIFNNGLEHFGSAAFEWFSRAEMIRAATETRMNGYYHKVEVREENIPWDHIQPGGETLRIDKVILGDDEGFTKVAA